VQSAIQKDRIKVTLFELNVQIKNVLKHNRNRVYDKGLRMQLHYLLVVIVVSDVSDKVLTSTAAVITNYSAIT